MLPRRDASTNFVAGFLSLDSRGYGEAGKPGIDASGLSGANLAKRGRL